MVTALKYGNAFTKAPELEEFQAQCLEPSEVDRAGAAAEAYIQALITALKAEWGHHLVGQEIQWRLWASWLVQRKKNDATRYIKDGPPNQIVGGFRPTSSSAQAQLLRVERGVQMTTKILEAVETKVIAFQQKLKVLNTDMDSLRDIINNHRDIVQQWAKTLPSIQTIQEFLLR
ncbi:hypothetical protein AC1031_008049 [Aphanomyces cochlioides]|nr:hypothetical protein AC1031_008049 [Aphanomyces cochlioides]